MKIIKIIIENFRGIKNLSIDLENNLSVFVGVNGAGKTTILDATAIALSWLINRIQRQNATGNAISDSDIRNETTNASIAIEIQEKDKKYSWKLFKAAKGTNNIEKSILLDLTALSIHYQDILAKEQTLPIIAYYPVNRSFTKSNTDIKGSENIDRFDVYENALGDKRNFNAFFEWFRIQDDITNETARSRTKWMQQNEGWIRERIRTLLEIIKETFLKDEMNFKNEDYYYFIERLEKDDYIFKEPQFLFHELSR